MVTTGVPTYTSFFAASTLFATMLTQPLPLLPFLLKVAVLREMLTQPLPLLLPLLLKVAVLREG
jgi:hypothetical protein